jgi:hypothetical protein
MLQEGLARVGVEASSTYETDFYRIKFGTISKFIGFFKKYFIPLPIESDAPSELAHVMNTFDSLQKSNSTYCFEFAIEETPFSFSDSEILSHIIQKARKIGLKYKYNHHSGIFRVLIPDFQTWFILFLELVQQLFGKKIN